MVDVQNVHDEYMSTVAANGWNDNLGFTCEAIAEAAQLAATKWRKIPRLNFESKFQVHLLRLLMPMVGRLISPARKAGLKPKRLVVGPAEAPVRIRLIEPLEEPIGIVVDIHGGAWTTFAAINDDPLTVPIVEAGFVVASVDYRLIPEHRLEDAISDCMHAVEWALSEACARYNVRDVFLHGDSAGAHLALCAALRIQRSKYRPPLSGLVLFFGAFDMSGTPSVRAADKSALMLDGPSLQPLFRRVSGRKNEAELRDPAISPLYADLAGLPPSLLVVGTNDPLLDDTRLLHAAILAGGAKADLLLAPNAPHAFNRLPIKMAEEANAHTRHWMKEHTMKQSKA